MNLHKDSPAFAELIAQYEKYRTHNDISVIRLFADSIMQIMSLHPISAMSHFAQSLSESIDRFDISAIDKYLNDYPHLIKLIKEQTAVNYPSH